MCVAEIGHTVCTDISRNGRCNQCPNGYRIDAKSGGYKLCPEVTFSFGPKTTCDATCKFPLVNPPMKGMTHCYWARNYFFDDYDTTLLFITNASNVRQGHQLRISHSLSESAPKTVISLRFDSVANHRNARHRASVKSQLQANTHVVRKDWFYDQEVFATRRRRTGTCQPCYSAWDIGEMVKKSPASI